MPLGTDSSVAQWIGITIGKWTQSKNMPKWWQTRWVRRHTTETQHNQWPFKSEHQRKWYFKLLIEKKKKNCAWPLLDGVIYSEVANYRKQTSFFISYLANASVCMQNYRTMRKIKMTTCKCHVKFHWIMWKKNNFYNKKTAHFYVFICIFKLYGNCGHPLYTRIFKSPHSLYLI